MKHLFCKKLLSAFLAVVMVLSCFTGAFSAYAGETISADTETSLYDNNLTYNMLGWVEMTDTQVLDAFLDFADQMMAENLGGAKGNIDIIGNKLEYDLSSINGLFYTLNSVRQLLKSLGGLVGGIGTLNVGGQLKGYASTGGDGELMTRENSSSKELIRGILNLLYMNGTTYAKAANNSGNVKDGGALIQSLLNGSLDAGAFEGIIIGIVKNMTGLKVTENTIYGIIGGLVGLPKGFEANLVNNVVVYLLKNFVADDLTKDGVNNKMTTSNNNYAFVDDSGNRLSIEQWAVDALNKGVLQTLIGVDSEYIFKNADGSANFEMNVNDSVYGDLYTAFVPIFEHTLLPLISTISVDFNFVTHFTKMYYSYVTQNNENLDASTADKLASYWTADAINNWINADYVEIGKYIGGIQTPESTEENRIYQFPGMAVFNEKNEVIGIADGVTAAEVKDAMLTLFNSLDRHTEEIDATKLFANLLYSPVAEALGCETGVLNLNLKDYYLTKYNLCNFFDWSVLPQDGSVKGNVYGLVKELLSFMFIGFDNWAPASATQDVQGIVDEFVASAGNLIKFAGDHACDAIFADYTEINESNIETASIPFIAAILSEVDITKHIHPDEWAKCDDIEGLLYVALSEYLHYALPQFDYSKLATVGTDGCYDITIDQLLPMARDALAYVMQPSVPITDKNGTEWDVFEQGGTNADGTMKSNLSIFDIFNYIVCFYAQDSGIAQLLNITKYSVNGTTGAAGYESAINRDNTLWQNLDIVINKFFPMLSKLFGVESISSEEFVMGSLVNGIANIGETNTTRFGHNNKGISAIFYNIVYMFTDSEVVNKPLLNVAYNFIRDLFNVILGARDSSDGFGDFIPANTGVQPFTDAIQNKILANGSMLPSEACATSGYSDNGLFGILIGRLCENCLAGELYTKSQRSIVDTVIPGLAFILRSVNDIVGFIPQLSEHTFAAPRATFNHPYMDGQNTVDEIDGQYVIVNNQAVGLNRAIFEDGNVGENQAVQLSRYYIKVTGAECINDNGLSVDVNTRYQKNTDGTITVDNTRGQLIAPSIDAYYLISGTPTSMGTKQIQVTYDIVNDKGVLVDPSYTGLTTMSSFYMTSDVAWYDQLYTSSAEINGNYVNNNEGTYYFKDANGNNTNVVATKTFTMAKSSEISICYPASIIFESNEPGNFANVRCRIANTGSAGFLGVGQSKRSVDTCYMYANGDATNWAIPVFDDQGNVLKLDSLDYYYPDANNGQGLWVMDNDKYEENGVQLTATESRTHIQYTADEVRSKYGNDHVVFENGICTLVGIKYAENNGLVTWGTPIKGIYMQFEQVKELTGGSNTYRPLFVAQPNTTDIEPGKYTFDICFPNNDKAGYATIDVTIVDTDDRTQTTNSYNEADKFQSAYMSTDFDNLTAEDAQTLNMSTSQTYYDAIQNALGAANAAIAKPISTSVVANNEKTATDRMTTVKTGTANTIVGDPAYQQLTEAIGNVGLEYYALNKDEFGNATSTTYYYMDKDGKYPYYNNTPVQPTQANFDNSAYVFVNKDTGAVVENFVAADAANYEVHYRNTVEYAKQWVFNYDTPYYATTSELTGKYEVKQFKYAFKDGSEASSKKAWDYKYPDVTTVNVPNDGTTDYRSEYLKQADLVKYVLELAKEHVSSAGAMRVVNEVIDDRKGLNETNFDMITYRMMVKAARSAEKLVSSSYKSVFVEMTTADEENYEVTKNYDFYVAGEGENNPEKNVKVDTTTFPLFEAKLKSGDYASVGLSETSVEGVDYYFGYWDVAPEYKNPDGSIKYDWDTQSAGIAINEAIKVYEQFRDEVVHRGYVENDLAFMKEIICATGDKYLEETYNNSFNVDALRTYTKGAFDATIETSAARAADPVITGGTVTFADTSATPKYGALENGVLVNNGPVKYTEESWNNYVIALASAVDAVDNAQSAVGYTESLYDHTAEYTHSIDSVQNLRTALMRAENELEVAADVPVSGHNVTAYIGALAKPADAYGTYAVTGATVTVGDISAVTDVNGMFTLEGLADGTYEATVTYQYGFSRTFTIEVNGADVVSDVMVGIVGCDISGDSVVNNGDYSVYKGYVGVNDMSSRYVVGYDFNRDGVINNGDYALYKNFIGKNIQNIVYTETVVK